MKKRGRAVTDIQQFTINSKNVVHENLDGEIVLIHLETGIYYSFGGIGTEIWTMIGNRYAVTRMVDDLAGRFQENRETISSAVANFLKELHKELLVVPYDAATEHTPDVTSNSFTETKLPFEFPRLEKYTDMQEFLMVDPIHEVTNDGWPHKAPPND